MFKELQRDSFSFFDEQVNDHTGLIVDSTAPGASASTTSTGMALTAYTLAVERGFLTKNEAIRRTLKVLRFFAASPQSKEPDATGYKGFYYHFLDMGTGRRAGKSELSSIDTCFLVAGCLTAAEYFRGKQKDEAEIRELAEKIYRRVDWAWMLNRQSTLSHGWTPEDGFLKTRWSEDYSEALLLYVLAMGSPTHPISPAGYREWTSTFEVRKFFDLQYIYAAPLFIHQFSHIWIDFKGIRDRINRKYGLDYFENSRRATYAQRSYAVFNPHSYEHYSEDCWGFTASDGPGDVELEVQGRKRKFYGYRARGAPGGLDDGTVSPWAAVSSLPFAPEIVKTSVEHFAKNLKLGRRRIYGLEASFNFTYPDKTHHHLGWVAPWRFGLNQGPIVIMIENHLSGLIWKTVKRCPYVVRGLKKAGFRGGWIDRRAAKGRI